MIRTSGRPPSLLTDEADNPHHGPFWLKEKRGTELQAIPGSISR
jgi:hypothetical protein